MGRRIVAVPVVVAGAAVLLPQAPARLARLVDPAPSTTAEHAVVDLLALLGAVALAHLVLTAVALVVLTRVAPRSRALVLAVRLTPARWRRLVLATAGAAVVVAATAPAAAPAAAPHEDVRPPPLTGLRLPDRPESTVPAPAAAPPAAAPPAVVVVRPGDSLWRIARRALPADAGTGDVARSVRHWYRANRDVVGPDPDLLLPGTRLTPPPPPQEARP